MRCKSCNTMLSDSEMSHVEADTTDFIDLCGDCYSVSDRATHNFDIDASDFDVEFNDGQAVSPWLQ